MRQAMVGRSVGRSGWGPPFVSRHFSPPPVSFREKVNEFHWDRESFSSSPHFSSPSGVRACEGKVNGTLRESEQEESSFRFYSSMRFISYIGNNT